MQNKGAVRIFAILLALVCLYQLSFTFVTRHVESAAQEASAGDPKVEAAYLDSIANEPVYFGLTYMECKSKEVNFGLDLKGGMNLILEVKISDVVKAISTTTPTRSSTRPLRMPLSVRRTPRPTLSPSSARSSRSSTPTASSPPFSPLST